ncbi:auxin-induced protein, partial [Trifolium medium]|nr:auxin-induced protein [Trifolium medium]
MEFKATELRLGLPGTEEKENKTMNLSVKNNKRQLPQTSEESVSISKVSNDQQVESSSAAPPS